MSEFNLTLEQIACTKIIEAIKTVWGRHGGDAAAALRIGVEGPEIANAISEVLYDLTEEARKESQ